jgi:hypothetical protein
MEDPEAYELEEMEKSYPKYDDMEYQDLVTNFDELTNRLQREVKYGSDPLVATDLNSELRYVKKAIDKHDSAERTKAEERRSLKMLFFDGLNFTVDISGPSGITNVPGVEFVEDPNNLLPDVLDAYDESFEADWNNIEDRLSKLEKLSTAEKKRDFKNQVERVQAVTKAVQLKEKLSLNPRNKYARELISRSSIRTLRDGTEMLMFRSEQGINKGGTQIMKRGKTSIPVYSKDSPALKEYKELVSKIREEPEGNRVKSASEESIYTSDENIGQDNILSEQYASREDIELIDMGEHLGNIRGLTMQENNELRGVLNPPEGSDLISRIGPTGALQIQAGYFNEAIGDTVELATNAEGVTEYNALIERMDGLKVARDLTLK